MQKSIFVIVMHVAEAVRFTSVSVSNILDISYEKKQPILITHFILLVFTNWFQITKGVKGYTGDITLNSAEVDMLYGYGEWGEHPMSREAMRRILATPKYCALMLNIHWNYLKPGRRRNWSFACLKLFAYLTLTLLFKLPEPYVIEFFEISMFHFVFQSS